MLIRLGFRACLFIIFSLLMSVDILSQPRNKNLLEKELEEKEAIIWYLGHSGWAIKTKNHLLIFDYVERGAKPAEPSLSNGYINPSESRLEYKPELQHQMLFALLF